VAFLSSIDVTVPTEGTSTVASLNDAQRAHRAATKGTIEVQHDLDDGRHKIPTGNLSAKPSVQVGDFYLATDKGQLVIGKDGSNWTLGGDLQYGTRITVVQATVPSGFTLVTGFDDKVLVGEDTAGQGGDTGGSWTISGLSNDTVATHTHVGGSHNHTIPTHTHTISGSTSAPSALGNVGTDGTQTPVGQSTHTHSIAFTSAASTAGTYVGAGGDSATTTASGSHSHTISSDASWRPAYVKVLVISKDTTIS
jgi:hypothetical protein